MEKRNEGIDKPRFKRISSGSLTQKRNGDAVEAESVQRGYRGSTTSSLVPEKLQDGSVILGRNGPSGNVYVTRYVINRRVQRQALCGEVLLEAFCPCTLDNNRTSPLKLLWTIISSESFVFALHLIALAFGVAKEAMNLRSVDEDMHLIHSVMETLATNLVIVIRLNAARVTFKGLRYCVTAAEHVEDPSTENVRGKDLRRWLLRFYVLAVCLIIFSVTCFLLFFFLVHLGWTILSNNFCLVAIMVSSNMLLARLNGITARIREDQHKAVLYETVLLLQEAYDTDTQEKRDRFFKKARVFSKALLDTELFSRPDHIQASDKMKPDLNVFTTMEMQSFV